jgi:hypothetical protein
MGEGKGHGQFLAMMEKMQKEQEEERRTMPRELMEEVVFDRTDPEQ